jgi:hypothetical protein
LSAALYVSGSAIGAGVVLDFVRLPRDRLCQEIERRDQPVAPASARL